MFTAFWIVFYGFWGLVDAVFECLQRAKTGECSKSENFPVVQWDVAIRNQEKMNLKNKNFLNFHKTLIIISEAYLQVAGARDLCEDFVNTNPQRTLSSKR